jgi:hypothetical protein
VTLDLTEHAVNAQDMVEDIVEKYDQIALKHFPTLNKAEALARPILYSNWLSRHYVPDLGLDGTRGQCARHGRGHR